MKIFFSLFTALTCVLVCLLIVLLVKSFFSPGNKYENSVILVLLVGIVSLALSFEFYRHICYEDHYPQEFSIDIIQ